MTRFRPRVSYFSVYAGLALAMAPGLGRALGESAVAPVVISVSPGGGVQKFYADDPTGVALKPSLQPLTSCRIDVPAGDQATLVSSKDHVQIVLEGAPTSLQLTLHEEDDRLEALLLTGRMVVLHPGTTAASVLIGCVGADGKPLATAPCGPGTTFVSWDQQTFTAEFTPEKEGGAGVEFTIDALKHALAPGAAMHYDPKTKKIESGPITAARDMAGLLRGVGMASANYNRLEIQMDLTKKVVAWDRGAQFNAVVPVVEQARTEIRQVVQAVQANSQAGSNRGTPPQAVGFSGANQVFPYSPAASSVVFSNGFNDILSLSARANALLTQTGSRGLGTGGPSLLSLPGFFGGVPTIGPPGLGGSPRSK